MLNAVAIPENVYLCRSPSRRLDIQTIFSEVRATFPGIVYELDAGSRTANAQAYTRLNVRVVRLYGGLAFYPQIGIDGLVFTLLHEIGHHFARGRRFASDPMLACDCNADRWAVTIGTEALQSVCGRNLDISRAVNELELMICSIQCASERPTGRPITAVSKTAPGCWASNWDARKFHLINRQLRPAGRCHFSA